MNLFNNLRKNSVLSWFKFQIIHSLITYKTTAWWAHVHNHLQILDQTRRTVVNHQHRRGKRLLKARMILQTGEVYYINSWGSMCDPCGKIAFDKPGWNCIQRTRFSWKLSNDICYALTIKWLKIGQGALRNSIIFTKTGTSRGIFRTNIILQIFSTFYMKKIKNSLARSCLESEFGKILDGLLRRPLIVRYISLERSSKKTWS